MTFSSLIKSALLALAMLARAACALPVYHVDLDTSAFSGPGFLDFAVVGTPGAPLARARIDHLSGAFGTEASRTGAVQGAIPAGFTLVSQAGGNWLTHAIDFGGVFSFDIAIDGDYLSEEGLDGATFVVGLFDALQTLYTQAASFAAQPGLGSAPATLVASADAPFASVGVVAAEVPEPGQGALFVLAGLAALSAAAAARRRAR